MARINAEDVTLTRLGRDTTLDINVVITRRFRLRMAVAGGLFKLAAWVLGCAVNIECETRP